MINWYSFILILILIFYFISYIVHGLFGLFRSLKSNSLLFSYQSLFCDLLMLGVSWDPRQLFLSIIDISVCWPIEAYWIVCFCSCLNSCASRATHIQRGHRGGQHDLVKLYLHEGYWTLSLCFWLFIRHDFFLYIIYQYNSCSWYVPQH